MYEEYLYEYATNDMKKLKALCNREMKNLGGITMQDYDDLYSIGLEVLWRSVQVFSENYGIKFEYFLKHNINQKYKTYLSHLNKKRSIPRDLIDYDSLSHITTEDVYTEDLNSVIESLNKEEKTIVKMRMAGYKDCEIRQRMRLSRYKYKKVTQNMMDNNPFLR